MRSQIEMKWTEIAARQLLGRKITGVRYMSPSEAHELGWYRRPLVLQLDDGNLIFPSEDDEGNGGGSLFTNHEQHPVLPLIE